LTLFFNPFAPSLGLENTGKSAFISAWLGIAPTCSNREFAQSSSLTLFLAVLSSLLKVL